MTMRGKVAEAIGKDAEQLAFTFCVLDRGTLDDALMAPPGTERNLRARPELGGFPITFNETQYHDFLELSLADWLEQVEGASERENKLFLWKRGEAWAYRRHAYEKMAQVLRDREPERLGKAMEMWEKVYRREPESTRGLVQKYTPPMSEEARKARLALCAAGLAVWNESDWMPTFAAPNEKTEKIK